MNEANLHELIKRYHENLNVLNNDDINEKFKWKSIGHFYNVWHSDLCDRVGFAKMFSEARRETSIMIDNSRKAPTSGIVKMAEKQPERVEQLFRKVLLARDDGNIAVRQQHVEDFITGIEAVRQELFPKYWKYKQERNDALAYLSMIEPRQNYLYRYFVTESFCRYIEYGVDIGKGKSFHLELYYQLCDQIVEALRQHPDLINDHNALLGENCFIDDSLHIMAFDLMYCARTHELYKGLSYSPRGKRKQRRTDAIKAQRSSIEEAQRLERIEALQREIDNLEDELEQFEGISLEGVEVFQRYFGIGTITRQDKNKIWVIFNETERCFTIHRDFIARPTFEDDEDVVDLYTEYGDKCKKLAELKRQLEKIR